MNNAHVHEMQVQLCKPNTRGVAQLMITIPQKHKRGINEKRLAQGPTPRLQRDRSSSYISHDISYYLQQWE